MKNKITAEKTHYTKKKKKEDRVKIIIRKNYSHMIKQNKERRSRTDTKKIEHGNQQKKNYEENIF
jgi:hypothetical protein